MLKVSLKEEGVAVPPPSVVANPAVEIWRDTTGAVYAYGETRGDECWMHVPGVASYRFTRQGDDVTASVADGACQDVVLDAYRRRVLPMAVQVRGCEVLHASAVRTPKGIVGLCGVSQTGKSTIAFGLSRRGYPLWCDDALAFDVSRGKPLAVSLPYQLRLRPPAMELFGVESAPTPQIESELSSPETAPLVAICALRRVDEQAPRVNMRPLSFADALRETLGHACWFTLLDAHNKRRVISHYMDLAAEISVFDVSFKSGLENLAAVLDEIESTLKLTLRAE